MKIIVDAFGGDNSPVAEIEGAILAIKEFPDIEIELVGDKEILLKKLKESSFSSDRLTICDAPDVIKVEDDPFEIRRSKNNSSMAVGLKLLSEGEGDAFVSGGSTGALAVGASFIVRRIKGVRRAALAPTLPSSESCFLLLDAGANLDCRAEMLLQFAVMGSIYMERVMGVSNPKVGLANVGAEPNKGTEVCQEAYKLMQQSELVNFVGNVEARDLPLGVCDVVVADGMSGNMILKAMEGMGKFFGIYLKNMFMKNLKTKLAAGLLYKDIAELKSKMDYTEYGGAIFLGASKPVIKAHGSSNANAFKNAIRQARACVAGNIVGEMTVALKAISNEEGTNE